MQGRPPAQPRETQMVQEMHAETGLTDNRPPPRERILKAAEDLFVRYGIRGVGVEAIAEAAGTNKMTLYRHFPSKDDLITAWLQTVIDVWEAEWRAIEDLPEGLDAAAQIDRFVDGFGNAFERCAFRGCALMNSLAELPEKEHPARRLLDEYKAGSRERMAVFFRTIGISEPAKAAEEVQLLMDGAKAGVQDLGPARSRARFTEMARTLLRSRRTS